MPRLVFVLIVIAPLFSFADVCSDNYGAGYVLDKATGYCMPVQSSNSPGGAAGIYGYYSVAGTAAAYAPAKKEIPEIKQCFEYGSRDIKYRQVKDDALNIQKMALTSDMNVVCKDMNDSKTPKALALAKKIKNKQPLTEEERKISKVGLNPWSLSIPENQEGREWVFNDMGSSFDNDWGIAGKEDLKEVLDGTMVLNQPGKNDRLRALVNNEENGMRSNHSMLSPLVTKKLPTAVAMAACSDIKISTASSCGKGLQKITDWMKIGWVSMPDLLQKVLTDKKFEKGIVRAAKKIIAKGESQNPGQTHLFDDLYESFKEAGSSDKEAKKSAWDAIGIISTAGPNLFSRLGAIRDPEYSDKTMLALSAISMTTPLLDLKSKGSPDGMYSYPKGMKFSCNNGKNYHFWMSAYFSHRLVDEERLDPEAAAAAAFTAEKGYQMISGAAARDSDAIFKEDYFSKRLNSMRLDMVQSSGGSMYGATGAINDLDKGFKRMINSSNPPGEKNPTLNWATNPVSSYLYFDKVLAPNSTINDWLKK